MRTQKIYPTNLDGTMNNRRAPSMCKCQAFGYRGNTLIEYLIRGTDTGTSTESGEELMKYYVTKTVTFDSYDLGRAELSRAEICLYVNDKGDAYRTWKGKLKGRPVCNFNTGYVFYY